MNANTESEKVGHDVKIITPTDDRSIISPGSRFARSEPSIPNLTMEQTIDEFLQTKRTEQTRRAYRSDLNQFFTGAEIGKLSDLAVIPFHEIVSLINQHLENAKRVHLIEKTVLNPATVNRKAYCLSSFFKHLVNVYHYPKNPLEGYQTLETDKESNTQSLSHGEIGELLKFAKDQHTTSKKAFRDYLIVLFLFAMALRRGEASKLKWSDIVNSEQPSIKFKSKGQKFRKLPLPHKLYGLLKEYQAVHRKDIYPYIFTPTCNNVTKDFSKPLSTAQIFNVVECLGEKVVPDKPITPHSLRKTFIELALDNREDFIAILNATGHSHTDMIRYYDGRSKLKNNAIHNMGNLI